MLFSASGFVSITPNNPPISGGGRRMMWYVDKAAFRVGYVGGTNWDKDSIGYNSFASGNETKAKGFASFAMGYNSTALGDYSTSLGYSTTTSNNASTAMGIGSMASGSASTAMGNNTTASGDYSTSMGTNTTASNNASTAMGNYSTASGSASTAMGNNSTASGNSSTAIGIATNASGAYSTAIGNNTIASGQNSMAMGFNTNASGDYSIALGNRTNAKAIYGFSIGTYNENTDNPNQYSENPTDRLFQIGNGTASNRSNAITIFRNGNTGIGNTDPSYLLDINKRIRLRSENASLGAGIWFNNNNNTALNTFVGNDLSNNLQVYSAVGNRTIAAFNPTTGGFRIEGPVAASSGNAMASFGGNGDFVVDKPGIIGGRFTIKENGNVGIGTNNPSQALHVVGNILASGTITPSDIRYKTNIHIIPNAIYKLMQLNGVYYHLRSEEFPQMGFSTNEQVGLIAQEVEAVMPNVVITNTDGYKGVDYAKLVPLLIESIKELNKKIEEQQKQIELLLKHVK